MTQHATSGTRPAQQRRPGSRPSATWSIPGALVALVAFPLFAGALRLLELAGGPQVLPANPRVAASPVALVLHVVGAAAYAVVGAFQFPGRIRRRHRTWHRRAGRVLIGTGLVVAGSGLWLTLFSADAPGGSLLWAVRLAVGSGMAACLVFGVDAIRRRDLAAHRAWMIRAYALAVGAGTQIFTQGIGEGMFGTGELSTALSVSAGWAINIAVAEWVIRRPAAQRARRARTAAGARP